MDLRSLARCHHSMLAVFKGKFSIVKHKNMQALHMSQSRSKQGERASVWLPWTSMCVCVYVHLPMI